MTMRVPSGETAKYGRVSVKRWISAGAGSGMSKRTSGAVCPLIVCASTPRAPRSNRASAAATQPMRPRIAATGCAEADASPRAASITRRTSRMSCQRASGSFSRHPRMTRSIAAGAPDPAAGSGAGSAPTIAPMIEIAVQHAGAMRGGERVADVECDGGRPRERHRSRRAERGESLALQVLEHEEIDVPLAADIEERADVRIRQAANRLRFTVEAGAERGVSRERRRQDLDGDGPPETRIDRFVDLTHAAGTERRDDFIGTQPGAGDQGHVRRLNYMVPPHAATAYLLHYLADMPHAAAPDETRLPTAGLPGRRLRGRGRGARGFDRLRGHRVAARWRYRLAPDPLQRKPKGVLPFWTRMRRLFWSWWPWAAACLWDLVHDKWGWAFGMGMMALACWLIAPVEAAPQYGLDHEFAIDDDEFLPTMAGATGVSFLPGNQLTILNNGDEFYPAMLAAIAAAELSF